MPLERGALLCRQGPATAGSQLAEAQRTKARPGQRENRMTERFEHPANLPVAPFVNRDIDDRASAPHRDDAHLSARGSKLVDSHSAIEQPHVVGGEPSGDRGSIGLLDAEARVKQRVRELAVIGQQERAARRVVEAADRNESRVPPARSRRPCAVLVGRAWSSLRRSACSGARRYIARAARRQRRSLQRRRRRRQSNRARLRFCR